MAKNIVLLIFKLIVIFINIIPHNNTYNNCQKNTRCAPMKIKDEIIGKEVMDNQGALVGKIKDLDLDLKSKKIDAIELEDTGLSGKIGLGEKKILPFDLVEHIGDKVIIKQIK